MIRIGILILLSLTVIAAARAQTPLMHSLVSTATFSAMVTSVRHHYPALPRGWVERQARKARLARRTITLINNPSEKRLNWEQYRSIFITPKRIKAGVSFYTRHRQTFIHAEQKHGTSRWIIAGILGVETYFGRISGNIKVLDALVTLAIHPESRRQRFFTAQLADFLLLVRQKKLSLGVRGSYAGAIGMGQFIPTSIRRWAVDGDDDGRIDLESSVEDAVSSIANYLRHHGWREAAPIANLHAYPSTRTIRFELNEGEQHWSPEHNFAVIKRYNPSNLYALAVYQLSQNIKALAQK